MGIDFKINGDVISIEQIYNFVFNREEYESISIDSSVLKKIENSSKHLYELFEKKIPVYGVTTGFGDSCHRVISLDDCEELQENLIAYLSCGTGKNMNNSTSKAITLIRLISLCRGYSGVTTDLVKHIKILIEKEIYPVIPVQGSLGASGDLIPLAYIGQMVIGNGEVFYKGSKNSASTALKENNISPYKLKPKEGLSLVNGTSAMAGLSLINNNNATFITDLASLCSSWLCLTIGGRTEAFEGLINEKAKNHSGQSAVAKKIKGFLTEEDYKSIDLAKITISENRTTGFIQDPYSLRCSPQILGPIVETIELVNKWLESEINSASDNPLIDEDGSLANGGNFYGGHLAHGMDYLKICLGNIADHMDRQLTLLINDKTNRGLPANLANWNKMDKNKRHLHHGLKGLHQLVSAVTSEIMAKSIPNSIFSRSSESHNQDKVSLGMSAAVQCSDLIDSLYNIMGAYLICLSQAIDLREIKLKGNKSKKIYSLVRKHVPFIEKDCRTDYYLNSLVTDLKKMACSDKIDL